MTFYKLNQMKKYLALLFFVFMVTLSFGQSDYQDVVYLKNGGIIRGIIIEQVPNKSIKIKTADRSVFVFQIDEIEKLTKEQYTPRRENPHVKSEDSPKIKDKQLVYNLIVELGYLKGVGDYGMSRVKLDFISSFRLNPYFSLGFGAGLRYYFEDDLLTPYYADIRVYFSDKKVIPYLSVGAGYSFNFSDFGEGGFLINPKAGLSFKVSDGFALNIGVGYEIQRMKIFHQSYSGNISSSTEGSGALSFILGFSF